MATKPTQKKSTTKPNIQVKKIEKIVEITPEINETKGVKNLSAEIKIDTEAVVEKVVEILAEKIDVKTEEKIPIPVEVRWKPDLQRVIGIKNISKGKLIYKSKRQVGYTVIWDKKGDMNYIELGEFINLKNSDRRFITEPWIRIIEDDEVEILKYAQILDNYKEILGFNNMGDIFNLDFVAFQKKFDKLPEGYKKTVTEMAANMIQNGQLDSIKIKKYIEKEMDTDLDFFGKE